MIFDMNFGLMFAILKALDSVFVFMTHQLFHLNDYYNQAHVKSKLFYGVNPDRLTAYH